MTGAASVVKLFIHAAHTILSVPVILWQTQTSFHAGLSWCCLCIWPLLKPMQTNTHRQAFMQACHGAVYPLGLYSSPCIWKPAPQCLVQVVNRDRLQRAGEDNLFVRLLYAKDKPQIPKTLDEQEKLGMPLCAVKTSFPSLSTLAQP